MRSFFFFFSLLPRSAPTDALPEDKLFIFLSRAIPAVARACRRENYITTIQRIVFLCFIETNERERREREKCLFPTYIPLVAAYLFLVATRTRNARKSSGNYSQSFDKHIASVASDSLSSSMSRNAHANNNICSLRLAMKLTDSFYYEQTRGQCGRRLLREISDQRQTKIRLYAYESWPKAALMSHWTIRTVWWSKTKCQIVEQLGHRTTMTK